MRTLTLKCLDHLNYLRTLRALKQVLNDNLINPQSFNCQRLKFFGKRLHYIMHALLKATVKFWCVLLLSFLNENKENMTNECLNSVLHTSGKGKKNLTKNQRNSQKDTKISTVS